MSVVHCAPLTQLSGCVGVSFLCVCGNPETQKTGLRVSGSGV